MHSVTRLDIALDGVTEILDQHGPDARAAVVDTIAARLDALVGEADKLRWATETRFSVVCPRVTLPGAARRLADRLQRSASEPVHVDGLELAVTASVSVR